MASPLRRLVASGGGAAAGRGQDALGDLLGLGADLGHGDDLPQGAAGDRADREQVGGRAAVGRRPGRPSRCSRRPGRAGPGGPGRRPASGGPAARRCARGRPSRRCSRSRAGPRAAARPPAPWAASAPRARRPAGSIAAIRPAWVARAPGARRAASVAATGGRHAVAVDVPPGPDMADEAGLVRRAQLGPQDLRVRPDRVDHGPPADAPRPGAADLAADGAEQRQQRAAVVGRRAAAPPTAWTGRGRAAAGRGARSRGSAPRSPARPSARQHIDHGEPGAEHDHRAARLQRCGRLRRPRVVDVAGQAGSLVAGRLPSARTAASIG